MRKTFARWTKLSPFFRAFLILSLVFLAVGLGTLGSADPVGRPYELVARTATDAIQTPGVVFHLETPTEPDGTTASYDLEGVYLNLANIYADAGTPARLRLERSTSGTSFTSGRTSVIENFFTPSAEGTATATEPDVAESRFNFVSVFKIPDEWHVSSYPYYRISAVAGSPNLLVNEVVFVGAKLDAERNRTGELVLLPAEIYAVTPRVGETPEEARLAAEALVDAQRLPAAAQSSFFRYGKDEVYTLMTIAEMRMGDSYAAAADGSAVDRYHVDEVYGAFGTDILALGTLIFGVSPFGLRFFPMLAAFGVLVLGARFVVRLARSERAGLAFSVLYALSVASFGLGHLGTPLMVGVFFFVASLFLCHKFYADGMKGTGVLSALPLFGAGLCAAAAICVNGAFVIPVAGVAALFVLGMVRQQKAKAYRLGAALAEPAPAPAEEGTEPETPERRAGKVAAEYREKNILAPLAFGVALVFGAFLIALISAVPAYFALVKAYDDPAAPALNVFALAWRGFANGYTGGNAYAGTPSWLFYRIYRGTGAVYAVTGVTLNPIALVGIAAGLVYAACRLVLLFTREKETDARARRAELRRLLIPLAGLVIALVTASFAQGAYAFILLAECFGFALAAVRWNDSECAPDLSEKEAKGNRIFSAVYLSLLALGFALFLVYTFSIPLAASVQGAVFGA